MPLDYWSIIKKAFHTTVRYPRLWLLGLFLAGGFNANFLYWTNLRLPWRDNGYDILAWLAQNIGARHHALVAAAIAIILTVAVVVMVNWIKIIFILYISDVLKLKRMRADISTAPQPSFKSALQESRRYVSSVIAMSIFTMVSTAIVIGVLGGGSRLLFASRGVVWLIAALVFIGLLFFFSCLNIFGTFFIIFYRQGFKAALNLATDLIIARWQAIAEMAVLLMIIYGLCFFIGTSLLYGFTMVASNVWLSGLLLWAWLAVVNTFFNISLLLLFAQLVQPPYHPEFKSLLEELPAPAPLPGSAASLVDTGGHL